MANGQPIKTGSASESQVDTSADLIKSRLVAVTEKPESENLSTQGITATTPNALRKTLPTAESQALRSKLSLVAGALADFQLAGGTILRKEMTYTLPSGRVGRAIKLILAVKEADLVAVKTDDGIEFNLVAESE